MTDAIILDGLVMIGLFIAGFVECNSAGARHGTQEDCAHRTGCRIITERQTRLMIMGFWGRSVPTTCLLYLAGLSKILPEL